MYTFGQSGRCSSYALHHAGLAAVFTREFGPSDDAEWYQNARHCQGILTAANDVGHTFEEIADFIEEWL